MGALLDSGTTRTDIQPVEFATTQAMMDDLLELLVGTTGTEIHLAFLPQREVGGWKVQGVIFHSQEPAQPVLEVVEALSDGDGAGDAAGG